MTVKRNRNFKIELKRQKAEAQKAAKQIRPMIIKDPDWPLATTQIIKSEDINRRRNALARITKKAVKAVYPKHTISVRCGRGTAHNWIYVDVKMPELDSDNLDEQRQWEYKNVCRKIEDILLALGIKYSTYFTDYGPRNSYQPCLCVTVNGAA